MASIRFENTIDIGVDRARVFAYLADIEHTPEWNWAIASSQKLTPGPVEVGTRFRLERTAPQRAVEELEVTALQPGERLEVAGRLGPFDARLSYVLSEVPSGTRIVNRVELERYEDFHRWSVEHPAEFWSETWDWCGVLASKKGSTVLLDGERMPGAKWFPEARLNFAQNLLRRGDRGDALVFWDETGFRRRLSYSELTSEVSRAAQALQQLGLRDGDRAAAFIPNIPEAASCALAASVPAVRAAHIDPIATLRKD